MKNILSPRKSMRKGLDRLNTIIVYNGLGVLLVEESAEKEAAEVKVIIGLEYIDKEFYLYSLTLKDLEDWRRTKRVGRFVGMIICHLFNHSTVY